MTPEQEQFLQEMWQRYHDGSAESIAALTPQQIAFDFGGLHGLIMELKRELQLRDLPWDDPRIYDAAKKTCFEFGIPWTDPRSGVTHFPPKLPSTDEEKR